MRKKRVKKREWRVGIVLEKQDREMREGEARLDGLFD